MNTIPCQTTDLESMENDKRQTAPEPLTADQQEWMKNEGLAINVALIPRQKILADANGHVGIDPSMVQLAMQIQTREHAMVIRSEFVRNTKGDINKLLKAQLGQARKALLDKHFEIVAFNPDANSGQ